jgi:predicted RNase H-like nuclease
LERSIPGRIEHVLCGDYKHSIRTTFNYRSLDQGRLVSAHTFGIDGCFSGWLIASRDGVTVIGANELASFISDTDDRALIGVDMPIGLPVDRPRACDGIARQFLRGRASTVFPAPARACLDATDHADADRRSRAAVGRGLPIQAYHLLPKIRELDAIVTPAAEHRIVEVHPECAFARLHGDRVVTAPKRTAEGAGLRRALLAEHFDLPAVPKGARLDDLLDAYAVLWSAERMQRGEHVTFGDGERDERGLLMRIVS